MAALFDNSWVAAAALKVLVSLMLVFIVLTFRRYRKMMALTVFAAALYAGVFAYHLATTSPSWAPSRRNSGIVECQYAKPSQPRRDAVSSSGPYVKICTKAIRTSRCSHRNPAVVGATTMAESPFAIAAVAIAGITGS